MESKEAEINLRNISYGELHLMFMRLVIDVQENPNRYEKGNGITEFIKGEDHRRKLFTKGVMRVLGRVPGLTFCPNSIPMEMLSEAMAQKNHSQTLSGLNGRGGLSVMEILANIKSDRIFRGIETQQDVDELNALITKWKCQHTEKDMCDFAKFCFNDWISAHERNETAKPTQELYKQFTNPVNNEETKKVIERVKSIHGDGYTYERREGAEVDLTKLKPNQRVCAGGNEWHILMTEIPEKL